MPRQEIIGRDELASVLGVSRARLEVLMDHEEFPVPPRESPTGEFVWERDAVERWARANPSLLSG